MLAGPDASEVGVAAAVDDPGLLASEVLGPPAVLKSIWSSAKFAFAEFPSRLYMVAPGP